MTDRLDRALEALREFETGTNPRAEETLERILQSARDSPRARSRVALWLPIAAVLAISTAALARPGIRETLRGFVARQLGGVHSGQSFVQSREGTSTRPAMPPPVSAETPSGMVTPTGPEIELGALRAPTGQAVATAPKSSTSQARTPSTPDRARLPVSRSTDSVPSAMEAATAAPASSAPVTEEDVYERAHRLHFEDRSPNASIAAWDEYLARFPSGRFVPEAQYNRAIDLLKLRRFVEARAALLPFAGGAYGAYHREDAQDLLRAIR